MRFSGLQQPHSQLSLLCLSATKEAKERESLGTRLGLIIPIYLFRPGSLFKPVLKQTDRMGGRMLNEYREWTLAGIGIYPYPSKYIHKINR